jgi:hypothetical protein
MFRHKYPVLEFQHHKRLKLVKKSALYLAIHWQTGKKRRSTWPFIGNLAQKCVNLAIHWQTGKKGVHLGHSLAKCKKVRSTWPFIGKYTRQIAVRTDVV